ncbi:hypothetical protein [Pseudonocardia zijingensis]|uniref:Uncharacterized protein n=1 Tax=Pseudonocardia zijingensis TaxID=153376 RepID=A0ABN1PW19_9PSEU
MTTTEAPAPAFRYIGTTDETNVCEDCGRSDLQRAVVLALLDADGNVEDRVRYGSDCAARALSIRGGGRAVAKAAENARIATLKAAAEAYERAERLLFDPATGEPTHERGFARTVGTMIRFNGGPGRWTDRGEAEQFTRQLIERSVQAVQDARLLGIADPARELRRLGYA